MGEDSNKIGKITILALSWRDIKSPKAGGAEVHTHEMLSRADKSKYIIYHFSVLNKGQSQNEEIDGVHYLRGGNAVSVIWKARNYYKRHKNEIDFVIDQCNTHRFFTPFWVEKEKRIFYIHQLTKEIWNYSAKFPLSVIGKMTEEWMLRINRKDSVITVSESTKEELIERGYEKDKIKIIHNGVSFTPWEKGKWYPKESSPTFIYVGRYSPYKGIDVAVQSFAEIKKKYPNAKLWILGKKNPEYVLKNILPICSKEQLIWFDVERDESGMEIEPGEKDGDIISWGFVSEDKKLELLSRATVLLFPSIREGWGIPITEAGCVGTPSIVFNSSGIREAIDYGKSGYLCQERNSKGLCEQMILAVENVELYERLRESAYVFSSQFIWDEVGHEFEEFIDELYMKREGKKDE